MTILIWDLLDLLLLDVPALVVWVVAAGAGDGGPDLVVAGPLPLVLAVLLVVSAALRLGVVLNLVPAVETIILSGYIICF